MDGAIDAASITKKKLERINAIYVSVCTRSKLRLEDLASKTLKREFDRLKAQIPYLLQLWDYHFNPDQLRLDADAIKEEIMQAKREIHIPLISTSRQYIIFLINDGLWLHQEEVLLARAICTDFIYNGRFTPKADTEAWSRVTN